MINVETTTERIENQGGMLLAGTIARSIGLTEIKCGVVPHAESIICELIASMIQGNRGFAPVKYIKGNPFFEESFETKLNYSEETVRVYFERMSQEAGNEMRDKLAKIGFNLLSKAKISGEQVGNIEYFIVDGDTSPMDNSKTKKEGVSYTYKGFDGYQPMFLYVGREGYMLENELREGSQHCQLGTPDMIRLQQGKIRTLANGRAILMRLDSGNDALETLKAITRKDGEIMDDVKCIVKRNLRSKSISEQMIAYAKEHGEGKELRKGKIVWIGKAEDIHPEGLEDIYCVYEVIERTSDHSGQVYLEPKYDVNVWWTNLDQSVETIIQLYHEHGTMEQFHSELKRDMNVERLPSGKFETNTLYLRLAAIAYNILRFIGQSAKEYPELVPITHESKRMRLGKVISHLIGIAAKFVRHARTSILKIEVHNPWQKVFCQLSTNFQLL